MKITTIPQIYRNVRRWTEILAVLSKYGLADWLSRLRIEFFKDRLKNRDGEAIARHSTAERVRMAFTELGGTFIKLGQILSTRPDIVGVEMANELSHLQCAVPPDRFESIKQIIETELGQPIAQLFMELDETPLATASIGQVHSARLHSGEKVVVKVQHANIQNKLNQDLDVLAGLGSLAERIPEFAPYHPSSTIAEMSRTMRRELDFGREERNLQLFASQHRKDDRLKIPTPHTDLCTSRVLTMEYIPGIPVSDTTRLREAGVDLEDLARRGAEVYLEMIFHHGFYHADPHPGNIVVVSGNVIGLLDFGMVGRIGDRLREDFEDMLMSIIQRDVPLLTTIIKRVGRVPTDLNDSAFSSDVADFVAVYANQPLDEFNLGGAMNEITEIIRRFHIALPPQVGLLIKVLVTLEGTTRSLQPSFSLMEVMKPFHKRMLWRRLSPQRQLRKMRKMYFELEQLAEALPGRLLDILEQIQSGKFDVHLDHRGLGPSVNRLVLGMLASALFLGSSVMLSSQVPPLLFPQSRVLGMEKISILGLTGCITSLLVGVRLLLAIGKSGHLDE